MSTVGWPTPEELRALLDVARESGVRRLMLPGLEAEFPPVHAADTVRAPVIVSSEVAAAVAAVADSEELSPEEAENVAQYQAWLHGKTDA